MTAIQCFIIIALAILALCLWGYRASKVYFYDE